MTATTTSRRRLTDEMLADVRGTYRAVVWPTEAGVVAGLDEVHRLTADGRLGHCVVLCENGQVATAETPLVQITGTASQLAAAGDILLGPLGYAGGIAQRCRRIDAQRPKDLRVVCGGWKKLPEPLKPLLREGLAAGGVAGRLVEGDFVYVDKNVVALSGGTAAAVGKARRLNNGPVAVQVTSPESAIDAVRAGASVVMDDTGQLAVLREIDDALREANRRDDVTVAFAGGVTADDLGPIRRHGADVVDLGRAILDAPLWDVHMVVES